MQRHKQEWHLTPLPGSTNNMNESQFAKMDPFLEYYRFSEDGRLS